MERAFDARQFGKTVIPEWDALSEPQRESFAALADAVVGGERREMYVGELCQRGQRVVSVRRQNADAITRVETQFVVEGLLEHAELWFRDDGDRWTFVGSFCCGVDVFILTWRDRLQGGYDAAMAKLRERSTAIR